MSKEEINYIDKVFKSPDDFKNYCYHIGSKQYMLENYRLTMDSMKVLVDFIRIWNIKNIGFNGCYIGDEELGVLSDAISNHIIKIDSINLDYSEVTDEGMICLLKSIDGYGKLDNLSIHNKNPLSEAIIPYLVNIVKKHTLSDLWIDINNDREDVYFPIFEILKNNISLKNLGVRCNLTKSGINNISNMMNTNYGIKEIEFYVKENLRRYFSDNILKISLENKKNIIFNIDRNMVGTFLMVGNPIYIELYDGDKFTYLDDYLLDGYKIKVLHIENNFWPNFMSDLFSDPDSIPSLERKKIDSLLINTPTLIKVDLIDELTYQLIEKRKKLIH